MEGKGDGGEVRNVGQKLQRGDTTGPIRCEISDRESYGCV